MIAILFQMIVIFQSICPSASGIQHSFLKCHHKLQMLQTVVKCSEDFRRILQNDLGDFETIDVKSLLKTTIFR